MSHIEAHLLATVATLPLERLRAAVETEVAILLARSAQLTALYGDAIPEDVSQKMDRSTEVLGQARQAVLHKRAEAASRHLRQYLLLA